MTYAPNEMPHSGSNYEKAIVIHADRTIDGIQQEYEWIEHHYGPRGVAWEVQQQTLTRHEDRTYDILSIQLPDGTMRDIFFDITEFFGRL